MDNAILEKVFDLIDKVNELEKRVGTNENDIRETQNAFNGLVRQLQQQSAPAPDQQ